jgi:hypothetical protein
VRTPGVSARCSGYTRSGHDDAISEERLNRAAASIPQHQREADQRAAEVHPRQQDVQRLSEFHVSDK